MSRFEGFTYRVSRPLTPEEADACETWLDEQPFAGEVFLDDAFRLGVNFYFGVQFNNDNDLLRFKLTWG